MTILLLLHLSDTQVDGSRVSGQPEVGEPNKFAAVETGQDDAGERVPAF